MDFAGWLPAISSTTLLGAVGFAVATAYRAKIETTLKEQMDRKLEEVRSTFRREEEALKAMYRRQEDELSALRAGALSSMTTRREALDQRRLQAAERLWAAAVDQTHLNMMVKMIATVAPPAYDAAKVGVRDSEKVRSLGEMIWKSSGLEQRAKEPKTAPIDIERPFLSASTWALFSTYRQIYAYAIAQTTVLMTGVGSALLADPAPTIALAAAALPHYAGLFKDHGMAGVYEVLGELQEKILHTLISGLNNGTESDEALTAAAEIIAKVQIAAGSLKKPADLAQ